MAQGGYYSLLVYWIGGAGGGASGGATAAPAGVPADVTLGQIRAAGNVFRAYQLCSLLPNTMLCDLIANPSFPMETRQGAANQLLWRNIAQFSSWSNYFLGRYGPVPNDPIIGLIIQRSAESAEFAQIIANATPIQ